MPSISRRSRYRILSEGFIPGELLDSISLTYAEGGVLEAAKHVGDDVVTRLSCSGSPDEALELIQARQNVGVTLPILGILGRNSETAMEEVIANA